nr:MAG TPA: lysozyme [Caudoviricetes sp.]
MRAWLLLEVPADEVSQEEIEYIARAVIQGQYGTMPGQWRAHMGSLYPRVAAEINRQLGVGSNETDD